jgi:hypothetical protein
MSHPSSSHMGSRRAKVEQKKVFRQTIFFGVLAVAFLIFFGLIVIPNVIRFFGNQGNQATFDDSGLPPQVPLLSSPVTATSSASLNLKGYNEKGNQVVLLQNGQETQRATVEDDGSFSFDTTLSTGDNRFTLYAIDPANKESEVSREYLVVFDNQPPKLEVADLQDKQSVQGKKNQMLSIKGTTDPDTKVTLNDRLVFSKEDGSFTTQQRLENGENTLTFKATDQAGNTTEKKIIVTFSE